MECEQPNTYDEAVKDVPNSVLPIQGLRRDDDGLLSEDAQGIVLDSLRSRGMDVRDPAARTTLFKEMGSMLCKVYAQYNFLMTEFRKRLAEGQPITQSYLKPLRERNSLMLDLLTISRRVSNTPLYKEPFVEGFQSTAGAGVGSGGTGTGAVNTPLTDSLKQDRMLLYLESAAQMRQHTITISQEKNRTAGNMLGMFGFLNIVAVGLLIYLYRAE